MLDLGFQNPCKGDNLLLRKDDSGQILRDWTVAHLAFMVYQKRSSLA